MARFLLGAFLLLAIVNVSIQAPTFTLLEKLLQGLQGIVGGVGGQQSRSNPYVPGYLGGLGGQGGQRYPDGTEYLPGQGGVYVPGNLGGLGGQGSAGGTVYLPGSKQIVGYDKYGYPDSTLYGPGWQGSSTNGWNTYYKYQ